MHGTVVKTKYGAVQHMNYNAKYLPVSVNSLCFCLYPLQISTLHKFEILPRTHIYR